MPLAPTDMEHTSHDFLRRLLDTASPSGFEQQIQQENLEYEGGFWVPNAQDDETLVRLDSWQGEWLGLATMRFVRVDKRGVVKESQFPPRGAS